MSNKQQSQSEEMDLHEQVLDNRRRIAVQPSGDGETTSEKPKETKIYTYTTQLEGKDVVFATYSKTEFVANPEETPKLVTWYKLQDGRVLKIWRIHGSVNAVAWGHSISDSDKGLNPILKNSTLENYPGFRDILFIRHDKEVENKESPDIDEIDIVGYLLLRGTEEKISFTEYHLLEAYAQGVEISRYEEGKENLQQAVFMVMNTNTKGEDRPYLIIIPPDPEGLGGRKVFENLMRETLKRLVQFDLKRQDYLDGYIKAVEEVFGKFMTKKWSGVAIDRKKKTLIIISNKIRIETWLEEKIDVATGEELQKLARKMLEIFDQDPELRRYIVNRRQVSEIEDEAAGNPKEKDLGSESGIYEEWEENKGMRVINKREIEELNKAFDSEKKFTITYKTLRRIKLWIDIGVRSELSGAMTRVKSNKFPITEHHHYTIIDGKIYGKTGGEYWLIFDKKKRREFETLRRVEKEQEQEEKRKEKVLPLDEEGNGKYGKWITDRGRKVQQQTELELVFGVESNHDEVLRYIKDNVDPTATMEERGAVTYLYSEKLSPVGHHSYCLIENKVFGVTGSGVYLIFEGEKENIDIEIVSSLGYRSNNVRELIGNLRGKKTKDGRVKTIYAPTNAFYIENKEGERIYVWAIYEDYENVARVKISSSASPSNLLNISLDDFLINLGNDFHTEARVIQIENVDLALIEEYFNHKPVVQSNATSALKRERGARSRETTRKNSSDFLYERIDQENILLQGVGEAQNEGVFRTLNCGGVGHIFNSPIVLDSIIISGVNHSGTIYTRENAAVNISGVNNSVRVIKLSDQDLQKLIDKKGDNTDENTVKEELESNTDFTWMEGDEWFVNFENAKDVLRAILYHKMIPRRRIVLKFSEFKIGYVITGVNLVDGRIKIDYLKYSLFNQGSYVEERNQDLDNFILSTGDLYSIEFSKNRTKTNIEIAE